MIKREHRGCLFSGLDEPVDRPVEGVPERNGEVVVQNLFLSSQYRLSLFAVINPPAPPPSMTTSTLLDTGSPAGDYPV